MVQFENGERITTIAAEQVYLPVVPQKDGTFKSHGHDIYIITWISGTIQYSVGAAVRGVSGTLSQAGDKFLVTLDPNGTTDDGVSGSRNLHMKGAGVVQVGW